MSKSVQEQIRSWIFIYFNAAIQDMADLNKVSLTPEQHIDKATDKILNIIETEVIGEDIQWQIDRNSLRQAQRNKLRREQSKESRSDG